MVWQRLASARVGLKQLVSRRLVPHAQAAYKISFIMILLGMVLAWAPAASPLGEPTGNDVAGKVPPLGANRNTPNFSKTRRDREGTELVSQSGFFRLLGDRVAFFGGDGKKRYIGLENLLLERVVRILLESTGQLEWNVTGTITEYRGVNYLFVRRAVLLSPVATAEEDY